MNYFDLFWIFLLFLALLPAIRQRMMEGSRLRLIHEIEKERNSRVILLVHRQETMSLLGFPIMRYIDIHDSEQVLRAIRMTPDEMPIDLILHTPGGLVLAAEQIARAIQRHKGKVTVFVPHYAMSGGTLIALAADEIVMDENAVLGPVDPQVGGLPAASILATVEKKDINKLEDNTLILADVARKAIAQMENFVFELLKEKLEEEKARELARVLTSGTWTHDYPITVEKLKEFGLKVSTEVPVKVYDLMELFPQPTQQRPSVQYIPFPYRDRSNNLEKH